MLPDRSNLLDTPIILLWSKTVPVTSPGIILDNGYFRQYILLIPPNIMKPSILPSSVSLVRRSSRLNVVGAFRLHLHYIAALLFTLLSIPLDEVIHAQENPFLAQNGLVVVQAESMNPPADWVVESSDAGYTGPGYIRWDGPDFFGSPDNGTIAIPFKVESSGNYWFKLRSSHLNAPAGDQWNDCWFRLNNGGTWTKVGHPAANKNEGFTFHMFVEPSGGQFIPPMFFLEAGTHTLYLSGRSFNFRIDRIHIYKDGTPDPENLSHPESPREDGNDDPPGGGVYNLTVNGGTGSGVYPSGTQVLISAPDIQNGFPFDQWVGQSEYIDNPFAPQTSVTMPSRDVTITASYHSTTFREPENPLNAQLQIQYEYFQQRFDSLPDFDTLTPVATGTTPTISLAPRQQEDEYLFRYSGFVDVPTDGTYTFYTASDDGSQLFIGDRLIVDNDSIQSVQERSGTIGLKAGKHAITVTYFERDGDAELTASWMGPGIPKQEIPSAALFHGGSIQPPPPSGLLGDVSLNGAISALDASMILSHVIGQSPLDGAGLGVADVSGDGSTSAFDASLILQYVVGLMDCFPATPGCALPPQAPAQPYNLSDR